MKWRLLVIVMRAFMEERGPRVTHVKISRYNGTRNYWEKSIFQILDFNSEKTEVVV